MKGVDVKKKQTEDRLTAFVERRLTDRNVKKYYRKEKQKRKSLLRDWGGSFLWAACVVFLINQYLFQAYNIPTPSMVHTRFSPDSESYPALRRSATTLSFLKIPNIFRKERHSTSPIGCFLC